MKSTKNNLKLDGENSICMEEIRQKVTSIKKASDNGKMSTPKSINFERQENLRLFSNGPQPESAKNEMTKTSNKKRGQFSNLRGSKQTLATQPKVNIIKPLFDNEKVTTVVKSKRPSEASNYERIERPKNQLSQHILYPNESEESIYSVATTNQKLGY